MLQLGGLKSEGEFEVFDSGGGWEFLWGKPLLRHFKTIHNIDMDTVTIQTVQDSVVLHNSVGLVKVTPKGTSPVHSAKQEW